MRVPDTTNFTLNNFKSSFSIMRCESGPQILARETRQLQSLNLRLVSRFIKTNHHLEHGNR